MLKHKFRGTIKNGKLVKFSSSEWGDISNIDHFLELT